MTDGHSWLRVLLLIRSILSMRWDDRTWSVIKGAAEGYTRASAVHALRQLLDQRRALLGRGDDCVQMIAEAASSLR